MRRDEEPEFVAELRLQLDEPQASVAELLAGAVTLGAMDYRALAQEYAQRAFWMARQSRDAAGQDTATAVMLTRWQIKGVA